MLHLQFELGGPTRCPTGTTLIFALWSNSRSFFSTARDLTRAEILRRTPTSPSEKLLVASSALRTYRNRCCEAWALVCRCFDPMSRQCTDNNALKGVIASFARANIDQRGNEVRNLPWAQEENEIIAKNIRSRRAWARVKPELTLFAVTDEEGVRLLVANDADPRLCRHWAEVFAARKDFPARQHFARLSTCDVLLHTSVGRCSVNRLMRCLPPNVESAPGPDGIPKSACRCAAEVGADLLVAVYWRTSSGVTPQKNSLEAEPYLSRHALRTGGHPRNCAPRRSAIVIARLSPQPRHQVHPSRSKMRHHMSHD